MCHQRYAVVALSLFQSLVESGAEKRTLHTNTSMSLNRSDVTGEDYAKQRTEYKMLLQWDADRNRIDGMT